MEALLEGNEDTEARQLITAAYDKLVRVMFESTEAIAKETVDFDDKEQGSHVVNIENMHHFYSQLRQRKVTNLENYMKYAKGSYESHLETYVRGVVRRSLLKLLVSVFRKKMDWVVLETPFFFDGITSKIFFVMVNTFSFL